MGGTWGLALERESWDPRPGWGIVGGWGWGTVATCHSRSSAFWGLLTGSCPELLRSEKMEPGDR